VTTVRSERGQVLVLTIAGMFAALLGVAALVIDVGLAYDGHRKLQAAVDAAALAGAQALPNDATAKALAADFGPQGQNATATVTVDETKITTRCRAAAPGCSPANTISVEATGKTPTIFARILGIDSITVHAKATACSPCARQPIDVMLVLDRTGSMCTPDCADLENAKEGMRTFLREMDPAYDWVGMAVLPPAPTVAKRCDAPTTSAYDLTDAAYVIVPPRNDFKKNGVLDPGSALVKTIDCQKGGGGTAYANAIEAAQAQLKATDATYQRGNAQNVIVLLSDGAANRGPTYYDPTSPYRTQPCHQGIASSAAAKAAHTIVYSIGYDVGHDQCRSMTGADEGITALDALTQIADSPENYYSKPDPGQLNGIFSAIAADILQGSSRLIDDAS
jgi:putative Flp pilus-assembly TadE/G-like protein/VWA domain-containing protein